MSMHVALLLLITLSHAQAFSIPVLISRRTYGRVSLLRTAAYNDDDKGDNDTGLNDTSSSSTAREVRRGRMKDVREGSLMAATLETGRVPYGETSRKFRRTVFSHDDWVEHRTSSSRVIANLRSMLFSGVVRQLRPQVLVVASVAAFSVVWNLIAVPALGSLPFVSPIILPSIPFTLSSPALGLLLVFRTNASYARWGEARSTWARMVAHGRNLIRMAAVFSDDTEAVQSLGKAVWLYCRTVMNQLSSPDEDEMLYQDEVLSAYGEDSDLARRILSSPDRPLAAWKQLSRELHGLPAVADPKALIETDKSIIILGECTSAMEKIYSSPVPLVYTRHTARFLSLWALLLPAALYSSFVDIGQAWAIIPASGILAFFLFGVDALSFQLEEPFSILPMKSYCDQILGSVDVLAGSVDTRE